MARTLGDWVDLQFARTADSAFAERFAAGCPWSGARPGDYLQRVVTFPGGEALTGIRFLGGSADFRFVDLLARTGTDQPAALARACEAALSAHAVFAPAAVRVRQARERLLDPGGWRAEVDQHLLVGRLDELADRRSPSGVLRLEAAEPEAAAAFTAQVHEQWALLDPALAGKVSPSGAAELQASKGTGVLAWLCENDERAGLIAVTRGVDAELEGYFVEEEVIALPFRGRGLAAEAQALVVAELAPESPEALLFGTIDAANEASLRTAERAGRVRVGACRFLFPPE